MLDRWAYNVPGSRDLRIDWLRGVAMTCVIVNHSRISSVLSWVSYERFWVVTAAEVFVALSGIVVGTVYGRRLRRGEWRSAIAGLSRRALTLYGTFAAVTLSVAAIAALGIDVRALTASSGATTGPSACFADLSPFRAGVLADIALMRCGPWAFQIVGLYVWLVAAAVPALVVLHRGGWRLLIAASWAIYLAFRFAPLSITGGGFEEDFPLLVWQLLFVHGLVIGYHREGISLWAAQRPRLVPVAVAVAAAAFAVFALSNPWNDGPAFLRWNLVPAERFTSMYFQYFSLRELGIGRIVNLAVALPIAYALLTRSWALVRPLGSVFLTLGQQSLGAFVLHVYGLLLLDLLAIDASALLAGTLLQIALVVGIAGLLGAGQRWKFTLRVDRRAMATG